MCAAPGTAPPHVARLTSAGRWNPPIRNHGSINLTGGNNPIYSNDDEGRLAIWVAKSPFSGLILWARLNGGVYFPQRANEFERVLLPGMGEGRSIGFENENILDSIGWDEIFLFLRQNKLDCYKSTPLFTPFRHFYFCFGPLFSPSKQKILLFHFSSVALPQNCVQPPVPLKFLAVV